MEQHPSKPRHSPVDAFITFPTPQDAIAWINARTTHLVTSDEGFYAAQSQQFNCYFIARIQNTKDIVHDLYEGRILIKIVYRDDSFSSAQYLSTLNIHRYDIEKQED